MQTPQTPQAAQSNARNAIPRRPPQEGELARNLAETFTERLRRRWQEARTLLCVGLDPELERLPEAVRRAAGAAGPDGPPDDETRTARALLAFNHAIVDATADLGCAYKPH